MADFAGDMQSFKPSSLPFLELDPNMEFMNQFSELNPTFLENPTLGFSNDNFLAQQQPELPITFFNNLQGNSQFNGTNSVPFDHSLGSTDVHHATKKQKVNLMSGTSSGDCLAPVVVNRGDGNNRVKKKNNLGRGKRGRNNERDVEKPKEVIHVRARRGQATDSHSLAERVRREKINEKLRCLQDLVPGCYKTMGMAVMLDEIITYVQSLQNQVEFLSMKLTAASSFYDFNSDTDVVAQTMQGTNAYEAQEVERLVRGGEGYGGTTCFHSTWPL